MIIWLASYPRSGNTLLRIILRSVFEQRTHSRHDDDRDIGADVRTADEVGHVFLGKPWHEAQGPMRDAPEPYFVKTHEEPQPGDDAKAIYVVRDGRAVAVSYAHYMRDFATAGDDYSVGDVIAGFTPFGSWSGHLDAWNPRTRPNTLLLRYEDLLADPKAQIARIGEFIGQTARHTWENNFEQLHRINPKFFRAGAANRADVALTEDERDAFWATHGIAMGTFGYGSPPEGIRPLPTSYVRILSRRGRAFFEHREHLGIVRQELDRAYGSAAKERAELQFQLDATRKELDASYANASRLRAEAEVAAREAARDAEAAAREAAREAAEAMRRAIMAEQAKVAAEHAKTAELTRRLAESEAKVAAAKSGAAAAESRAAEAQNALSTARAEAWTEATRAAHDKHAEDLQHSVRSMRAIESRLQLLCSSKLLRAARAMRLMPLLPWLANGQIRLPGRPVAIAPPPPAAPPAVAPSADAPAAEPASSESEMDRLLRHLIAKGFRPRVVLDIGAAKGFWSEAAQYEFFPDARFHMIDPLAESETHLKELTERSPEHFRYVLCAIGREPGTAVMNLTPDFDGSSLLPFPKNDPSHQRTVPVETIDRLVEQQRIEPPDLVKIDVQGFELEVLAGGRKLFDTAEVFIIEVSLYQFMPGNPLAHDVVRHMADRGYRMFDFAGYLRRPFEDDLAQTDIVFVKNGSPLVSSNRWS